MFELDPNTNKIIVLLTRKKKRKQHQTYQICVNWHLFTFEEHVSEEQKNKYYIKKIGLSIKFDPQYHSIPEVRVLRNKHY